MRLLSYGKEITKGDNILEIYKYALLKGTHYYEAEYVDTILKNMDKISIEGIYNDLVYIYRDIELLDTENDKCIVCGKDDTKKIKIGNINLNICNSHNNNVTPKEFYYIDFLKTLNSLYELIEFTINNEVMLYTNKHIDKNLKVVETNLGKISIDVESNIFYIHK